jgi:hypothetical protein
MALELVSPPKKLGGEAGVIGAFSPDGTRALYKSKAALADTEGLQSYLGDNYVATRTSAGWSTEATSLPREYRIAVGGADFGGPFAFAPDLSGWLSLGATQAQKFAGEGQFFIGGPGGAVAPLSPSFSSINDTGQGVHFEISNLPTPATSADLTATVFRMHSGSTGLFPEDPRGTGDLVSSSGHSSYLAFLDAEGAPTIELLARDKDNVVYGGRCGSQLGGGGANQGAISPDGDRIYFSTRPAQPPSIGVEGPVCDTANPLRIFARNQTPAGPVISELLPGEPSAPGNDLFQGASVDGSKVFLASPRKLTPSDKDASSEACSATLGASKGCDLYLYDADLPAGSRLTQVSAGENVSGEHEAGKAADVLTSTVAISSDGSRVYFVAQGVLTDDQNPAGATATASQPNLYLYEASSGETSFIGTLAASDAGNVWGAPSFMGDASAVPMLGPEGGEGHLLVFASRAPLTADDTDGGFADVFRYDSVGETLVRVSKAAPGGGETPSADVGVNSNESGSPSSNFAEQGRWVSEDGQTIAFASSEPLAPGPEAGLIYPYLYKGGALTRLPGEVRPGLSRYRPVVSAGGETVGFTSYQPLVLLDRDTAADAYLARVGGGFPDPAPPAVCDPLSEGSCQGPSGPSAVSPLIATSTFVGPGNASAGGASCAAPARRARRLSRQAKRLRGAARRSNGARRAKRLRRSAANRAKKARNLSRNARRCRQANRRSRR